MNKINFQIHEIIDNKFKIMLISAKRIINKKYFHQISFSEISIKLLLYRYNYIIFLFLTHNFTSHKKSQLKEDYYCAKEKMDH